MVILGHGAESHLRSCRWSGSLAGALKQAAHDRISFAGREITGLRIIDGEQYDVIRDGHHVGTFMDTGDERFVCRPFIDRSKRGMKATRRTLDDAVLFILERGS